jgi:hypothetical protein
MGFCALSKTVLSLIAIQTEIEQKKRPGPQKINHKMYLQSPLPCISYKKVTLALP